MARDPFPDSGWPPSAESILDATRGDGGAQGRILAAGYRRLVSFYRGMGLGREAAEDLASETTEAALKGFSRLRNPEAFESWYWTIARNRLRTFLRAKGRKRAEQTGVSPVDPADKTVETEEHLLIRHALQTLPLKDRQVLWLREVEELEYEEIAHRLGLRPGATRVAAMRARNRLTAAYLASEIGNRAAE